MATVHRYDLAASTKKELVHHKQYVDGVIKNAYGRIKTIFTDSTGAEFVYFEKEYRPVVREIPVGMLDGIAVVCAKITSVTAQAVAPAQLPAA